MVATLKHTNSTNCCWITWERHQRSRSLASQLQIPLVELASRGGRLQRYVQGTFATIWRMIRCGPEVVYVQVPSIVLGHLILVLAFFLRFRVVADLHNAVVEGAERASQPMRWFYRSLIRRADLVIVTNSSLMQRVRAIGGRAAILPDPVPAYRTESQPCLAEAQRADVVVISTWAEDEPLREIIEAADLMPPTLSVTITGRPKGPHASLAVRSSRVKLSGFVSDSDYVAMLNQARVVIDLTTREDCLVCGAYEALALGRPLIVSDSKALRELLREGAIFVKNESVAIAHAVTEASANESEWADRCARRRETYIQEWHAVAASLLKQVNASV